MLGWLEFSLLDMTPYDRETWFNLLADYNLAVWPAYGLAFFLTLILLLALFKLGTQTSASIWARLPLSILAASWIWTGAIFHMQYFSQLNWAASWFGLGFIIQGFMLLIAAFSLKPIWVSLTTPRGRLVLSLLVLGLVIYPLSGFFDNRRFAQLEWLPLLPTPVTLITFATLMGLKTKWRHVLILIPIVWAIISAAFAATLGLLEVYFLAIVILMWGLSLFD